MAFMLQIILTLNITIVYSYLCQGCEDAERLSMMSGNNYEHVAKSRSHCVACGIGATITQRGHINPYMVIIPQSVHLQ